jgi:tetratricopeptide (TPR) repeat protein
MAVLLKRAGRLAKAAEVLELARKLRPQELSARQNLGNVHELPGEHAKAAQWYRTGSRIDPKSVEMWRLTGRELATPDRLDEAADCLRRAPWRWRPPTRLLPRS